VDETVTLTRVIQGELPFTLNLPEGTYPVLLGEVHYPIKILQNHLAVADGPHAMRIGTRDDLREYFCDRWDSLYKHELRTIVCHWEEVQIRRDNLPVPTHAQLFEAAQQYLLRATPGIIPGGPEQLQLQSRQWMDGLSSEDREAFAADTSVRLAAVEVFPHHEVESFCHAVNVLVRLYMATFQDRFVQEISESMFSGTAFQGIHSAVFCNGQQFDRTRYAGGLFPFIMHRPWKEHPPDVVATFRVHLENSPDPDPVVLLGVRARSLLLRGAYRSAIVEASAALDLAVSRKIRAGFRRQGQGDEAIEKLLRKPANQRFDGRAKQLLRDATGQSAADFDNTLWTNVGTHRATYRQGVTHADREPPRAEAERVVDDFLRLAELVDGITPR
jgi:hypothetical protein